MKITARSSDIGKAVCEVLGLDPAMVRAIDIRIVAGEALMVSVERFVSDTEDKAIKSIVENYECVPKLSAMKPVSEGVPA